ncbi:carboxypeptidase-like regulatory domain-containing protein, partial [Bacillus sp. 7884-1]|uniref:carboxypeptidase-like regulatory domain-containing protein n=1 Tax=Bacillus sp. 7884-1 TaxID=2021693 RepID=UPI000BD7E51D
NYAVPVKSGISTGYKQDFESQPIGWISYGYNNSWEWGVPTGGPGNAASGEKVYGTKLNGNYDNYANMNLMLPPIVLPEGNAYLQFKDWYRLDNSSHDDHVDYGHVLVSTDEQNWQQLSRFTGNSENLWTERQIDLSAYAGQKIYIIFNVTADAIFTSSGWYIDDVALSNTSHTTANVELEDLQQQKLLARQLENEPQTNKKVVNLDTIQPTKIQNVMAPTATITPTAVQPMSLPLGATVSVLESGRSVTTNPIDGSYVINAHPSGEFTLRAETYGYESADQRVNISKNGTVEANFTLNPISKGTVSGTVTNKQTGQPIANATL